MQSPAEITEPDTYWLRSKHVSDSPAIGGDAYFERHDVPRAAETSEDDLPPTEGLPPADHDAARQLDRKALDEETLIGKWQVTGSAETVERLWPELLDDAEDGVLWAVKAMTQTGFAELPYDEWVIVVYTPNYFAKADVDRVRDHLRDEYGVTHELFYKPDLYTKQGMLPDNAGEFGLSQPARYVE